MIANLPHRARPIRLRGVVFDWAGTLVDFGSRAPVAAFIEVFRRHGVAITAEEARRPMGKGKRDHLAELVAMPRVAAAWQAAHRHAPAANDIDRLYADFLPAQADCLIEHADVIPGVLEALADCRRRDLRIGSSTGYDRSLMEILLPAAEARGCQVDAVVTASDVSAGRPAPWMILECARRLDSYPPAALVVVDDTTVGVEAGRNAAAWSVGVVASGNLVGASIDEFQRLTGEQRSRAISAGNATMQQAGAHYSIDSVADLPPVLDDIERRLAEGDRP
jgi:phosphonoacetaldehyde hydrolase